MKHPASLALLAPRIGRQIPRLDLAGVEPALRHGSGSVPRRRRRRGRPCAAVGRQNPERAPIRDAEYVLEFLQFLLTTLVASVRPRHDLVVENLLLRHQLTVLTRPTRTRSRARLQVRDKLLWILARRFFAGWRECLTFVTPDTVVRWHRQGWRLFWRWKSRSRGGRPHLTPEVRDLIATMSRTNRLWGTERIRGELLKLGIFVSNRGGIAGADQSAHRARPGARSCATMLTTSGPPIF